MDGCEVSADGFFACEMVDEGPSDAQTALFLASTAFTRTIHRDGPKVLRHGLVLQVYSTFGCDGVSKSLASISFQAIATLKPTYGRP